LFQFENYDHYVRVQTACNKAKIEKTWVGPDECKVIAATVQDRTPLPAFGICHGVRNGYEVRVLRELLAAEVIGTDISDTAEQFPFVVRWDFHEPNVKWIGRADFIYSNSLDHGFDPKSAVAVWVDSLAPGGILILHWSTGHDYPDFANDGADCFAATKHEYADLLATHFAIVENIPLEPRGEGHEAEQCLIVGSVKR
jgi:SAM-dependent methyltransferase